MKTMLRMMTLWLLALSSVMAGAALKVSALHPLMADLAKQVGGERVQVSDLVEDGVNMHRFEPKPGDMKTMQSSQLVMVAGKGMESYLERLKANLGQVTILEVGKNIPSLKIGADQVYTCCPNHASGAIDPHWWHGIENMKRASRIVAQAFAEKDPDGKSYYENNAKQYSSRLEGLKKWAKSELSKIPSSKRKLVTAHNAFAYFAKEFGYEVIAVAGLSKEQNVTPQEQAKTIEEIKKTGIQAVFPEVGDNEKAVASVAKTAGVSVAKPLISDGNGKGNLAGFEAMVRYNVTVISQALQAP